VLIAFAAVLRTFHRKTAPVSPAPSLVVLEFRTSPSSATIRIDRQDRGSSPLRLELEEGKHQLEALKEGYRPSSQILEVRRDSTTPVTLALEPLPLRLELFSGLKKAQIQLDGRPAGEARDGRWSFDGVGPGRHILRISIGEAETTLRFEAVPGSLPTVGGPSASKSLKVVLVSILAGHGRVQFNFSPTRVSLDDQPRTLSKSGELQLSDLSVRNHLLRWEEGKNQGKVEFESRSPAVPTIFLSLENASPSELASTRAAEPAAVAAPPESAASVQTDPGYSLRKRAYEAYQKGHYAEPPEDNAISYASQALQLDPKDYWSVDLRAMSVYKEKLLVQDSLKNKDFLTARRITGALAQLLPNQKEIVELQKQVNAAEQAEEPSPHQASALSVKAAYRLKQGKYPGTLSVEGQHLKFVSDAAAGGQAQSLDIPCSDIKDISGTDTLGPGAQGLRVDTKAGETFEFLAPESVAAALKSACAR
jgi:hypothetical protein